MSEARFQFSQPQFDFLHAKEKYVAAVAGFGSGKTHAGLSKVMRNMLESPGIDQAYLAPTYPLIRDIFYPAVEKMLPEMGLKYEINQGKHIVYIQGLGKIYCRTMEKPGRIIGWEACDAVLDELDVLSSEKALEVIHKINARLRQKHPTGRVNQVYVTTTPEGFKTTYKLFKKDPIENSKLIQMSTYSNQRNLPADYIENLRKLYPAQLIDAYLLGKFVNITSGTVYNSYDRIKNRSYEKILPKERLYIGQDFNVNKMASSIFVPRTNGWHIVGELVDVFDTPALIDMLNEKFSDHPISIYPDASGKNRHTSNASESDLSLLKQAGFKVRVNKKNPFVKDRIISVNAAFCHNKLWVNDTLAPTVADCLEQQTYDKNGEPDKSSGVDHMNDGTGYFVVMEMPVKKPIIVDTGIRSAA